MRKLIFIFFLTIHLICQSQTIAPPVTELNFKYEFTSFESIEGSFLSTQVKIFNNTGRFSYPAIFDSNGYLAWFGVSNVNGLGDFKYYPNDQIYSYSSSGGGSSQWIVLNSELEIMDTILAVEETIDPHDIQKSVNGNWLISTITYDTMDLSAYEFNGQTGLIETPIKGYGIQELDPNGNVVFEWNSNDFIHPTESYEEGYNYNESNFDYCHGNAIEEDVDGHILISFRHLNAIYKINRQTGTVMWILGGKSNMFTFINDNGFSGQHDIRYLGNNTYSLFDNDNMGSLPKTTKGKEYELDTLNWTATLTYSYTYDVPFFARAMGNFQTTSNGDKMLGYGYSLRPKPSSVLLDANSNIKAVFNFEDSVMTYRMFHYPDLNFNRPEIYCEQQESGWLIHGPENEPAYLWTNNETTSSIWASENDTVQVFIPHGHGYMSSLPIIVDSINCSLLSIPIITDDDITNKTFKRYTLSGKQVNHPIRNQVYIKVYEDGTFEKEVYIKNE